MYANYRGETGSANIAVSESCTDLGLRLLPNSALGTFKFLYPRIAAN